MDFKFDSNRPLEGSFKVAGTLEIPALALKQGVNFLWRRHMLDADFESKFAGFTVLFGVQINTQAKIPTKRVSRTEEEKERGAELPKPPTEKELRMEKWMQMRVKFGFKDDFDEWLTKLSQGVLQKLRDKAVNNLEKVAERMRDLQARGARVVEGEIAAARESIARTEQRIRQAKAECAQARWYKKAVCAKVAAQESKLLAKKMYLNVLLKPKKAVIKGVTQIGVAQAKALRKVTEVILDGTLRGLSLIRAGMKLFRVKEMVGDYSSRDFWSGKGPHIKRLVLEMYLSEKPMTFVWEEIQFDFHNPKESMNLMVQKSVLAFVQSQQSEYLSKLSKLAF